MDIIPKKQSARVGPRGGIFYDNKDKVNIPVNPNSKGSGSEDHPPTYCIEGPGVDMAFFRVDGGFRVRYAGPYCDEAIQLAKTMLNSDQYSFRETIDYLCKEFNCSIIDNEENKKK